MPAEKKRGERKMQILQVIAEMLQDPKGERITTALLAKKLDVSEPSRITRGAM